MDGVLNGEYAGVAIEGLGDIQNQVLREWSHFVKAAVPVVEQEKMEAAMRYCLCFGQVPRENRAAWASQAEQVAAYVHANRAALEQGRPHDLPRGTRDVTFDDPAVDIHVNVAAVLFACKNPQYANDLWGVLGGVARACGLRVQAPQQAAAAVAAAAAPGPAATTGFFEQLMTAMSSMAEQQAREHPVQDPAQLTTQDMSQHVMQCLRSPMMESLVSSMMQRTIAGEINPMDLLSDSQRFLQTTMASVQPPPRQ